MEEKTRAVRIPRKKGTDSGRSFDRQDCESFDVRCRSFYSVLEHHEELQCAKYTAVKKKLYSYSTKYFVRSNGMPMVIRRR